MDKKSILNARGVYLENVEPVYNLTVEKPIVDDLQILLYSPNRFGWPCNDIEVMETTSNAEVKQAITRRNQPLPTQLGDSDADVVLDTLLENGESLESYTKRMQPYMDEARENLYKSD